MKFCDQEAKKKPKRLSKLQPEESKLSIDKSEHEKVLQELKETKNLCLQKDELITQKQDEIQQKDKHIEEKSKEIMDKFTQIKNYSHRASEEEKNIKVKEEKILQQKAQIDKLLKDKEQAIAKNVKQAQTEKEQEIKDFKLRVSELEKKEKIQQNIISQLQKKATEHQALIPPILRSSPLGNATPQNNQKLIPTAKSFKPSKSISFKDHKLCRPKGEMQANINPLVIG